MKEVPKFHELMLPTLKALKELGGSGTNSEILDKVIEIEKIPENIQEITHTTGTMTKLDYNLAWAKSYLKMEGALENSERGVWSITDVGTKITSPDQISKIVAKVRQQGSGKRKLKITPENEDDAGESTDWKLLLLDLLQNKLTPKQFEKLTQRILRESGFIDVEVTGKTGDGGIDGHGILKLGLLSFKVIFQCKRFKNSVGSGEIRDFRGAMQGRAEKGLFVTSGTFTKAAKDESKREGATPIDLIDGDDLCEILKKLKLGLDIKVTELVEIKKDWFSSL